MVLVLVIQEEQQYHQQQQQQRSQTDNHKLLCLRVKRQRNGGIIEVWSTNKVKQIKRNAMRKCSKNTQMERIAT